MKNRTKRQCKDRYMLFLAPTITNLPWTYEEDVKLYEMVKMFGKKWTILVRFFNGRSVVNLKNRYKMRVESMMEQDVNSPVMDNLSQTSCYTIPLIHHSNKHE
ncbi:hypothetical protein TRFO_43127 [Tritrichomonas foetus]|uniref:Uncharacterized protein n=1 Tax=Tritrichomonas foetus TaxID=1144522 RepID=A0A1J4KSM1_9EUKA|nr:hypothetical protein TRFO_43127 [Tritrichomonas foetus]|eukprot:OHT14289.1 hypothetical protein TRFO_43127 [Tritrichomonas foetus]